MSLKGADFYDAVLLVVYSLLIYLVYARLTLLLWVVLVYTEGVLVFSSGIIKYVYYSDVKYTEVVSIQRPS